LIIKRESERENGAYLKPLREKGTKADFSWEKEVGRRSSLIHCCLMPRERERERGGRGRKYDGKKNYM
jgi:hypothetical protein